MTQDVILGIIRHALTFGGGFLATKGYGDSSTNEQIGAALMTIVGLVWSIIHKKQIDTALKQP